MKATRRNTLLDDAKKVFNAINAARDWRKHAASIETAAQELSELYPKPIKKGNRTSAHPARVAALVALAEVENMRRAVDAGDAGEAASAACAAVFALWHADDTLTRACHRGQGLVPWRGAAVVATPAETRLLRATRSENVIDLPAGIDRAAWSKAIGSASRAALKVCIGKLNRRFDRMGLNQRFRLRGERLIVTS